MSIIVKSLPALNGDSIILSFIDDKERKNIIIDGGNGKASYIRLKKEINLILQRNETIDLLVITHTDQDHIFGIMKVFQDEKIPKEDIKKIWFNSGLNIAEYFGYSDTIGKEIILGSEEKKLSIKQGITLEDKLKLHKSWERRILKKGMKFVINGIKITILSPTETALKEFWNKWEVESNKNKKASTKSRDYNQSIEDLSEKTFKEDTALPNKTSISFLMEYQKYKILMLADSHPSVIESSLRELGYSEENKIQIDLVKVSHHGSKHNTSSTLLSIINCKNFLISTNGSTEGFPHKESLSRIIKSNNENVNFYFNYKMDIFKKIFTSEEIKKYNIALNFMNDSLTLS